ncbi:HAD-IA family hydrolase [Streptomyces sp. NPDC006530]|uniref:HAD-IA family hydrolase n=1 Tax=Streptomyces sp. NPDC006530 TaxID=3364750 RepID=UPI00367868CF
MPMKCQSLVAWSRYAANPHQAARASAAAATAIVRASSMGSRVLRAERPDALTPTPGRGLTRGKPDPEPFLLAAARLGVDPARCVVFEDAPAGLAAARAAGMTTVALATTHRAEELLADMAVKDLSAVSALVTDGGAEITAAE